MQQLTSCQFSKFNPWPYSQQQLSISALQAWHIIFFFLFFNFFSCRRPSLNTTLFTHSLLFFTTEKVLTASPATFSLCSTSKSCVLTSFLTSQANNQLSLSLFCPTSKSFVLTLSPCPTGKSCAVTLFLSLTGIIIFCFHVPFLP